MCLERTLQNASSRRATLLKLLMLALSSVTSSLDATMSDHKELLIARLFRQTWDDIALPERQDVGARLQGGILAVGAVLAHWLVRALLEITTYLPCPPYCTSVHGS